MAAVRVSKWVHFRYGQDSKKTLAQMYIKLRTFLLHGKRTKLALLTFKSMSFVFLKHRFVIKI